VRSTLQALTHRLLLSVVLPAQAQFLFEQQHWAQQWGEELPALVKTTLDVGASRADFGLRLSRLALFNTKEVQGVQEGQGGQGKAGIWVYLYLYLDFDQAQELSWAQLTNLQNPLQDYFSNIFKPQWMAKGLELPFESSVSLSRLELKLDLKGKDWGQEPGVHYVVQTDVEEGWMPEIEAWYDREHMPGLARVPGCMSAKRFINHDSGARSFACYDLESALVLTSKPWMDVRGTEWSSRARPHFVNPQRLIMRKL